MAESRTALCDLTKKWQVFLCAREVKVEFRTTFLVKLQRAVLDSVNKRNGKISLISTESIQVSIFLK